jgi:hypothetical protein
VQSGKTASGGCSAGPRFVRACSATDLFYFYSNLQKQTFDVCLMTRMRDLVDFYQRDFAVYLFCGYSNCFIGAAFNFFFPKKKKRETEMRNSYKIYSENLRERPVLSLTEQQNRHFVGQTQDASIIVRQSN